MPLPMKTRPHAQNGGDKRRPYALLPLLALLSLALTACSLAGDVTPPPGAASGVDSVAPRAVAPQVDVAPVSANSFPSVAPSIVQGATVYAEHCAACHGPTGRGDGDKSDELKAQLTEPIPDFSTPDRLSSRTPGELYQTVTSGKLDRLMPPFGDKLTDAERWSAVAFLYTLSAPATTLERGQAVFEGQCAQCHAAGSVAVDAKATDFTDQAFMAATSQAALIDALAVHKPALEKALTTDEAQAVSAYERALSFSTEAVSAAETNVGAPAASQTGLVSGKVTQGTQGAALPAGLAVVLRGYDNFNQAVMLTSTVAADGTFAFDAVPEASGRQYMLTLDYAGLAYGSDIFNFEAGREVKGLAMTVYESTTDTSALRIERLHLAAAEAGAGGPLTFSELVLFGNQGDLTISPTDGIELPLPQGATAVAVQGLVEGNDYTLTADGIRLLWPVRPGPSSAQISFTFQLPAGAAVDYSQRVAYPVQALDVAVSEAMTLTGDGLQDRGTETLQSNTVHAYSGGDLTAGSTVAFKLTTTAGAAPVALPTIDPIWAAVAIAFVAIVAVGVWWQRRRANAVVDVMDEEEDVDALLQTIADLDDAFAEGALDEPAYRARRASLKAQLVALAGSAPT